MDEFEFGWFLPLESCGDDINLSDDVIIGFSTDCVDDGELLDEAWGGDVVFDASTEIKEINKLVVILTFDIKYLT